MSNSKLFVLVLMPVDKTFDDIYQLGIKQTCTELDIDCERADAQHHDENRVEEIHNQLSKADLIIADMTGKNATVFFQTGYAFGIGKKPLLLTQKVEDLPFDLHHNSHIVYQGQIIKLREELTKKLQWCLSNSAATAIPSHDAIEYSIHGISVKNKPCINTLTDDKGAFHLTFNCQNITKQVFKENVRFCVVVPNYFTPIDDLKTIEVDRGTARMILLGQSQILYPGESQPLTLTLCDTANQLRQEHTLELQVFSEVGTQRYPFTIIME